MRFFYWLKWKLQGSPMIAYPGYNCGCCGAWVAKPFKIRTIDSCGKWWDTWGVCPVGTGCRKIGAIPFPECYKTCSVVKVLGVSECESVCPHKFCKDRTFKTEEEFLKGQK